MIRCFLQQASRLVCASALVLASFFGGLAVHAQTTNTSVPSPKFSVASVKPDNPNAPRGGFEYIPKAGKFDAHAVTLDRLIGFAYDSRLHQIVGGPKWIDSAPFTIEAIADESAIPMSSGAAGTQMFRTMLQSLLAERFQLVVHQEIREGLVYELVVGKHGSKLKEGTEAAGGVQMGIGQLSGRAVPMFLLVNQLSRQLGRTVIDRTGLTGKYDFTIKWEPDLGPAGLDTARPDSPGPSIFTAVQEDLGLRLQATKGPVKFIVIDRLERPDAN